ncbi:hypothetical protein HAX54_050770, partial [Datura stramonium]|nr:hypothetical protein [Datura stramonium]
SLRLVSSSGLFLRQSPVGTPISVLVLISVIVLVLNGVPTLAHSYILATTKYSWVVGHCVEYR